MAQRARGAGGWWSALPVPIRIGTELIGGYLLASTLSRFLGPAFAGFEVVVVVLILAGVVHGLGKLALIEDFPSLRAFFDWYSPSANQGGRRRNQAPPPPPPPPPPPDISGFVGTREVMLRLQQLAGRPIVTGKPVLRGAMIVLRGPKGTGKSGIAHAWSASLLKGGVRKKELRIISRTRVPGLVGAGGPSEGALQTLREEAEAALDGVLLIDDLDCLIPSSSDPHAPVAGETLLEVAQRNPKRLLIVASGSEEALAHVDPRNRWLLEFQEELVEVPALSDDALYAIFERLIADGDKQLEPGTDATFRKVILREIKDVNFSNALTIRKFAGRVIGSVADRRVITKADLLSASRN